ELLGGNMIVETIFAWPGLGRLVVSSIFARYYVVVQAAVMLYALTYVAVNLIVDVLYTYLNPMITLCAGASGAWPRLEGGMISGSREPVAAGLRPVELRLRARAGRLC